MIITETVPEPSQSRQSVAFIFMTILIDSIGIGLLIPVIPELIQQLAGVSITDAAVWGGAITALFATMQFLCAPILGNLSDQLGRRPVLLLSLTGFGINYILMGFAPSLVWLFVAQALAGMFGATPSVAAAYIADVTPPALRAKRFGYLGAAFGIGFMVGPVLSGLVSEWGVRVPFFVAAGLSLMNVCYGYWVLPESLDTQHRRKFQWSRANPWGAFTHLRQFSGLVPLLVAVLLLQLALQTVPVTWPYFTGFRFDWGPREVGMSLGLYGLVGVITQGILMGRLVEHLGDVKTVCLGLGLIAFSLMGFALVTQVGLLVLLIIPSAMGFMTNGAMSGYLSSQLPANEQGALQGTLTAINSLASMATPLLMPWLFSVFANVGASGSFSGMPYVVGAAFAVCALLIVMRLNNTENPA